MTHLDKKDIRAIIAHHFGVPEKDVMVDCYMDTVDYGMDEHEEPFVRAVITTYKDTKKEIKHKEESSLSWIYLDGWEEANEKVKQRLYKSVQQNNNDPAAGSWKVYTAFL